MGTTNVLTDPEHTRKHANSNDHSIESFFTDTVILVTGATGFLGKALLEKLLRACPRLAIIFILIRPKKGRTVEQRFSELIDNPVFDRIRWDSPCALKKIIPIEGDVSSSDLGLSSKDRKILTERVNIVFHSAATVKFEEPLKVAVNLNTRGTDRMIELCRNMRNLISLVHVSTAYSNADKNEIKETVYETAMNPYTLIDMCENLDEETLNVIEKRLTGKHPNTYTFTKSMAEQVILMKGGGLPMAVVRPSIVGAAYQEPFPGWVDNVGGITGVMMEIGRGTMRSIVCNVNMVIDLVPVDMVVDTLICASWHTATSRSNDIHIYNCTSGASNPLRWGEMGYYTRKHAIECPTKYVLWYPGVTFRTNEVVHSFAVAALHFFPAFLVDLALKFKGAKPIMLKTAQRIHCATKRGQFFATNEWYFHEENMRRLCKYVKASSDFNRFNVDIQSLDWNVFVHQYMLGIRKYLLKEHPDTLGKARNRLFVLYWIHKITQLLSVFLLVRMLTRIYR